MTKDEWRAWRRAVFGSSLTPAEKVVVLALETFADYPAGTNAFPGNENLAAMCGLKIRVVESALAEAKRLGFIEQTRRAVPKAGLAAVYRLLSIRTDTRVETDSTRTDTRVEGGFYPHETDLNPHETAVEPAPSCGPPTHNTNPPSPSEKPPPRSSSAAKTSAKWPAAQAVTPGDPPQQAATGEPPDKGLPPWPGRPLSYGLSLLRENYPNAMSTRQLAETRSPNASTSVVSSISENLRSGAKRGVVVLVRDSPWHGKQYRWVEPADESAAS